LTVREAVPADSEAVAELLDELGYPVPAREAAARLGRAGGERVLVAESGGRLLGLVAVAVAWHLPHAAPLARITALVVAGRARGRGVARRLMASAEALAAAAGCEGVELTSALRPDRAAAHRLYDSLGYERTSHRFWRPLHGPVKEGDSGVPGVDTGSRRYPPPGL
jgi:GNAT superfamily N-acetyltransferase